MSYQTVNLPYILHNFVCRVIGEDALLKFVSAHNLSGHIPKLRARVRNVINS